MTFVAPTASQPLHVKVYAAFGSTSNDDPTTWRWTDITQWVKVKPPVGQPVTLSGGRSSLSGQADPSQISLSVDNTDGRFTAQSPLLRNGQPNPYWPYVVRDTPLKVAVTWDGAVTEYELLTAFVGGWPLRPNAGLINVSVPITAFGRLRALRRTNKVVASALFRAITANIATSYDGYWPMEDPVGSQQFVAEPSSMPSITLAGVKRAALAANSVTPGSNPLPDLSSGIRLTAKVPQINIGDNGFCVDHVLVVGDTPSGSGLVTLTRSFMASGSWQISLDMTNSAWQMDLFDTTGATVDSVSASWASTINPFDGQPHMIRLLTSVSGAVVAQFIVDNHLVLSTVDLTQYSGNVVTIGVAGVATSFPLVIGHLLAVNISPVFFDNTSAMNGYVGEVAWFRFNRLCNQYGIPVTINKSTNVPSQLMGPQTADTLANLLDSCAAVDNALLHDAGPGGGLVFTSGTAKYNAAVGMTLDYNLRQVGDDLAATYDDQDLVTSTTINRVGGSSATSTLAGAADFVGGSDTVNAEFDTPQLGNIAGWRTHVASFDSYRLPTVDINMRTTPTLAEAATTAQLPFRLSPINIPSPYPAGSLDQLAEAFTTTIDSVEWRTTYSCTPYLPWQVAVYHTSRYDASGSLLAAPVTATATTLTAPGSQWSTTSTPYGITVGPAGGERCTVTAVAASGTAGSRVGAFLSTSALGAADFTGALANFTSITGLSVPVVRQYQAQGDFGIGTNLSQMVSAGKKICITLRPDYNPVNPAHITAIDTMLASMKASGAAVNVTLWHEPFFSGLTAKQFVRMVKYYGPTVRKYYPLWVVYSGADADVANDYYPGDAYCDGVGVDAYATSSTLQVTNAQSIADMGNKPFGVWEFNGGADLGQGTAIQGQSQSAVTAHFQYIQDLFTARLAAGKPNGDLLFFSSPGLPNGSQNFLGTSLTADGGFETGLGNWIGGSATLAQTAAQAHSGTKSGQITAPGGGGTANILMCATGSITTQGLPCVAGQVVAGMGWFRSAVTARSCRVDIAFFDSGGGALSTITGSAVTDSTSAWTSTVTSGAAPASTAYARIVPAVLATAGLEVHYFDDPEIAVLPATNDLTSPIQYPWDYRIALLSAMITALDNTSPPQALTVTRGVNGIKIAHSAGDALHVYPLPIYAL